MYQYINEIFLTEAFSPTPAIIADMVKNKRVISIYYMGGQEDSPGWRTVEPACYGRDLKGRQAIRAYQTSGKTLTGQDRWKFFLVERIRNWNLSSNKNFEKRPKFNESGDAHMSAVYAISDFKNIPISPLPKSIPTGGGAKSKNVVKRLRTLKELYDII